MANATEGGGAITYFTPHFGGGGAKCSQWAARAGFPQAVDSLEGLRGLGGGSLAGLLSDGPRFLGGKRLSSILFLVVKVEREWAPMKGLFCLAVMN